VQPGARFGRLTVIRKGEPLRLLSGPKTGRVCDRMWLCRCDCGVEKLVRRSGLVKGGTSSCGCLRAELGKARATTHGHWSGGSPSGTWVSWQSMLNRCRYETTNDYDLYGGRGVYVCARWDPEQGGSFENFLADMGERPEGTSIDKEIKGGRGNKLYNPENCCWATQAQQQRNRRDNRMLTYEGETLCMSEWAERFGLNPKTLSDRLDRGHSLEVALNAPASPPFAPQRVDLRRERLARIEELQVAGMSRRQIAVELGLSYSRIGQLLQGL
jgi:hypothetical protein